MIVVQFFLFALQIFNFIVLARVLLSWVPNVDRSNPLIQLVYDVTEPVLKPIRQALPQGSGVDFSPIAVFIGIYVISSVLQGFIR